MAGSNLEALEVIVNKDHKKGALERTPWEELLLPVRKKIIEIADRIGNSRLGYELAVHTGIWQGFLELAGQSDAMELDGQSSIRSDISAMLSDAVSAVRRSSNIYSYRAVFENMQQENIRSENDLSNDIADIMKLVELGKYAAKFGEASHVTRILAGVRNYVFTAAEYAEKRRQAINTTAVNGTKIASDLTDAMINLELGESMRELATAAYRKIITHYQMIQAEDERLSGRRDLSKAEKDRYFAIGRMKAEIQDYYTQILSCYTKARALVKELTMHAPSCIEAPELNAMYIERKMITVIKQYQRITGDPMKKYANLLESLENKAEQSVASIERLVLVAGK